MTEDKIFSKKYEIKGTTPIKKEQEVEPENVEIPDYKSNQVERIIIKGRVAHDQDSGSEE